MPEAGGGEREALMEAMTDSVIERGFEGTTVAAVVKRAGLDQAAFRRHFQDKADCFLQIYLRNNERFGAPIFAAFERDLAWRDSLREAAYGAARFLRDHPREVQFNVMVTLGAGEVPQAERDAFLQSIIDLIDRGRREMEDPDAIGRAVAEGVMGSIYSMLVKELQGAGSAKAAEGFVPELMYIAVRPYLGHEIAKQELSIPAPPETQG